MPGFGFGYELRHPRLVRTGDALPPPPPQPAPLPLIEPSALWTGTAASGFTSTPADPTRTTAKPACRLITPPRQTVLDEVLVGVSAWANNEGSLYENCGLSHVVFHYEGTSATVAAPSFRTFEDANGNPVTYFGWWARLKHNGTNGIANLYVEAVPGDPTMQHRVIGPYPFLPSAIAHDYDLTVEPSQAQITGSRYANIRSALLYLRSVNAQRPRITITEPGLYDIVTGLNYSGGAGYCLIEASVPITIGRTAVNTASPFLRPYYHRLHFRGSNITFDFAKVSFLLSESGSESWVDGINATNSEGRDTLWFGSWRPRDLFRDCWMTECVLDNVTDPTRNQPLARGCTVEHVSQDICNNTQLVIGCAFLDGDPSFFREEKPALTISYAGAGTGTVSLDGVSGGARTMTFKVDGASVGSFGIVISITEVAGGFYTLQNLVDYINGLSGWSATLDGVSTISETGGEGRAAAALSLPGQVGNPFTDLDATASPLVLVTMLDVHSDFYQIIGPRENLIVVDNRVRDIAAQHVFVKTSSPAHKVSDIVFANNVFETREGGYGFSQLMCGTMSHIVLAHNSWVEQPLTLRPAAGASFDGYTLIANNAVEWIKWDGTPDGDVVISNNHFREGEVDVARATGTTFGGTEDSWYADRVAGDYSPAGELLANRAGPILLHDLAGARRRASAPKGALA